MAKDPAALFYTSDFRQGTITFTEAEAGQYIWLLCDQHQTGHLPESHMMKICHRRDSPVWAKFKKDDNGLWFNARMDEEKERRAKYSESRRKNRLSKSHEKDMSNHMSPHMETETGTDTNTGDKRLFNNSLPVRRARFSESLVDYADKYPGKMLTEFIKYWGEPDLARKYMKFEKQETWDVGVRLERWAKNQKEKAGPESGVNTKGQGKRLTEKEIYQ